MRETSSLCLNAKGARRTLQFGTLACSKENGMSVALFVTADMTTTRVTPGRQQKGSCINCCNELQLSLSSRQWGILNELVSKIQSGCVLGALFHPGFSLSLMREEKGLFTQTPRS